MSAINENSFNTSIEDPQIELTEQVQNNVPYIHDIVEINQKDTSEYIKKEDLEKSSSCEDQEIPAKKQSDVCFLCRENGHKKNKCPKKKQKAADNEKLDISDCSTDIKAPLSENVSTVINKQKENTEERDIDNCLVDIKLSITESETKVIDKQIENNINEIPHINITKRSTETKQTLVEKQDNVNINQNSSEHIKKENIREKSPSSEDQKMPAKKKRSDICFLCRKSGHKKKECLKKKQKVADNEKIDISDCSTDIKPPLSENESTVINKQKENTKELDIANCSIDIKPSITENEIKVIDKQKENIVDIQENNCNEIPQINVTDTKQTLIENKDNVKINQKDSSQDIKKENIQEKSPSCEDQEIPAKKKLYDGCFICHETGHKKAKCPKKKQKKQVTECQIDLSLTENQDTFQNIPKVEINRDTQNECVTNDTELNMTEEKQSVIKSEITITEICKSDTNECKNDSNDFKSEDLVQKQPLIKEESMIDDLQNDDTNLKSQACYDSQQQDNSKSLIPNQVDKINSELCYHCQTAGHKQNACPQKNKRHAPEDQAGPASKKLKAANCYLCGESGHKKTKCPKKHEIEARNTQQSVVNKNATEEDDDAKSDNTSDSNFQDSQPESFVALNPGKRLLLKKLPKSWTAKDVTHFLHDKCEPITKDLKKVVLLKDKKNKCWGLEFASPNACLEARTLLHQIGSIDEQKFDCLPSKDQSIGFTGSITVNTFIRTKQLEMPYPAFSHDLLLSYIMKQRQEETFGLNKDFLNHLNITLPLTNKIFVKNLSKEVTEQKLREVFEIAGTVMSVKLDDLSQTAKIEFQHPVESVQAISMLDNQELFGQKMHVRQDKYSNVSPLFPVGLSGVGIGLGQDGIPLRNVWDLMEAATVKQKLTDIESQMSALDQKLKKHDSIIKANNPQTLIKVPQKKTNLPQAQTNVPQKNTNVPQKTTNVPQNQMNLPHNQMNVPQNQMNLPHNQMNVPQNQMNISQNQMNVPQHPMNMQPMPLPPSNQTTMPLQNQMSMPQYPMQQIHMGVPPHHTNIPQMQMVDPLYHMNMQQHQMNMLANPMDMMQQYPNVMPQSYIDVSHNQMNVIPHETPQYYVNMPQNEQKDVPKIPYGGVPQNKADIPTKPHVNVPQNKVDVPKTPYVNVPQNKANIPKIPETTMTQTTGSKKLNPVQSKTATQSKATRSHSELQQMQVREFIATIRSKERESPDNSDLKKHEKDSPPREKRSLSKGHHSYSPTRMSISSEDEYNSPPPDTKKRRSASRSKEKRKEERSYRDSGSSYRASKYSKDSDRRSDWKTTKVKESDRLLFTNLPKSVTVKALESKMSELGEIRWVDLIRVGRAIVRFKDPRDAARCIKLYHGSKVDGQTINVVYDNIP